MSRMSPPRSLQPTQGEERSAKATEAKRETVSEALWKASVCLNKKENEAERTVGRARPPDG